MFWVENESIYIFMIIIMIWIFIWMYVWMDELGDMKIIDFIVNFW